MSNKHLSIAVILRKLSGNQESIAAFGSCIGKTIATIKIDKDDNALFITFNDGIKLKLFDDGQTCCETRYMHSDDDLTYFVGGKLLDGEVRKGSDEVINERGGIRESEFLIITTSKGQFTVVNYNEHNGYYGGFDICVEMVED